LLLQWTRRRVPVGVGWSRSGAPLSSDVKPPSMKTPTKLAVLAVVIACAIIAGALWALSRPGRSNRVKWVSVRNAAFQDQFAAITEGTNHVIFREKPVIAAMLRRPPLHWLERWFPTDVRALSAGIASIHTPSNSTVLWLGWTSQLSQPLCLLTDSGGRTVPLQFLSGPWVHSKYPGFFVQPFELPSTLGKFHGNTVHVYTPYTQVESAVILQLP
jgi:hypothetical protein